ALFARFFNWYAPYFNAYSYVLARSNEYAADRMALAAAGPEAAGSALVRVNLLASRLENQFWPELGRRIAREPAAPTRLYTDMRACLRASFDGEATALDECLRAVPDAEDTHPTLRQRLEAIGARSRLPEGFSKSAAEAWLGPLEPVLEQAFSERWHHHN